jgi:hypothetical protein
MKTLNLFWLGALLVNVGCTEFPTEEERIVLLQNYTIQTLNYSDEEPGRFEVRDSVEVEGTGRWILQIQRVDGGSIYNTFSHRDYDVGEEIRCVVIEYRQFDTGGLSTTFLIL